MSLHLREMSTDDQTVTSVGASINDDQTVTSVDFRLNLFVTNLT